MSGVVFFALLLAVAGIIIVVSHVAEAFIQGMADQKHNTWSYRLFTEKKFQRWLYFQGVHFQRWRQNRG